MKVEEFAARGQEPRPGPVGHRFESCSTQNPQQSLFKLD